MLKSIKIKNVALIENLETTFEKGLNILSGETGAGKSIIIDSLEFVLGRRADKTLIRYGSPTAEVAAEFYIENPEKLYEIFDEYGIERENEIIISRIMSAEGSNQCRVNGVKVTLGMLKNLTSLLTDIYGQHEAVELLDEKRHLPMLDSFKPSELADVKSKVASLYAEYKNLKKELSRYGSAKELAKNLDILEFQIKEIEDARLEEGEEERLDALRRRLNNTESFLSALSEAEFALGGFDNESNAAISVSTALKRLNQISEMDETAATLAERLESLKIELSDVVSEIAALAENSEYDQNLAAETEARWELIKSLKRKYGDSVAEIIEYGQKLSEEYDFYKNSEQRTAELETALKNKEKELYGASAELSNKRKSLAADMAEKLTTELAEVGMKDVKFQTFFKDFAFENHPEFSENGIDEVTFYISVNKGQPLKPLAKTVSGGETSRFMLCLKSVEAATEGVETMVFDEIDTGISGAAAEAVAKKMYSIASKRQVLAVTHIAQIAAMADNQYLVSKSSDGKTTFTTLKKLDKSASVKELARLIDGENPSDIAIAHAEEMKGRADAFKKN